MRGELDVSELAERILNFLSKLVKASAAILYINGSNKTFYEVSSCGFVENKNIKYEYKFEDIITGCSLKNRKIYMNNGQNENASYSEISIENITSIPLLYNNRNIGVLLFICFDKIAEKMLAFISDMRETIAITMNSAISRQLLQERNTAINNLLNNAGQGFLTFDNDLLINKEYSLECLNIFGTAIEDRKISELFYPETEYNYIEQRNFIDALLSKIICEIDNSRAQVFITLLPNEILLQNKNIRIEYKLTNACKDVISKNMMVVLTDITEQKFLESQMEIERKTLKMVVKVATNYNDFLDVVNDFKNFYSQRMYDILDAPRSVESLIFEIFRAMHTFKGSFSQMDMTNIVSQLHNFETEISKLKNKTGITLAALKTFLESFNINEWLEEDLAVLKEALGDLFVKQDKVLTIDKLKLIEIETKITDIMTPTECREILPKIRKLRYKPFADFFKPYSKYVENLSEQFEKHVNPLIIKGDYILVDPDKYKRFINTLAHIFRNIIDHGLELPDERINCGKEEKGSIVCETIILNNLIMLTISDDGAGINREKLKNNLIKKKLYTQKDLEQIDDDDLLKKIFLDGVSTKDSVSKYSGRGVGLAAVRQETENLCGSLSVKSEPGKNTVFNFYLPYENDESTQAISYIDIISPIVEIAIDYFKKQFDISVKSSDIRVIKGNRFELNNITATANLKGIFRGTIIMSANDAMSKKIVDKMLLIPTNQDDENFFMIESISESLNVILGNSIKKFSQLENLVILEPPVTMSSKNLNICYSQYDVWMCRLEDSGDAYLDINLVVKI